MTDNVPLTPGKHCNSVPQRRALARRPPKIGYILRTNDVENFTGDSPLACNERELLYWGPQAPSPALDRPAVFVRLTFLEDDEEMIAFVRESIPTDDFVRLRDGTQVRVYGGEGQAAGRFAVATTIVDVRVACADETLKRSTRRCERPTLSPEFLRTRLLRTLRTLEPQLRARLGTRRRLPPAPGG